MLATYQCVVHSHQLFVVGTEVTLTILAILKPRHDSLLP